MVVDNFYDHLRRSDRAHHLLSKRLFPYCGDEISDHRQGHIGLEQRDSDLAQGSAHIGLGQRTVAAQPVEDLAEAITKAVEHSGPHMPATAKTPVRETRGLAAPGSSAGIWLASSRSAAKRSAGLLFCQLHAGR